MLFNCATSYEVVVTYPEDADWDFYYYDSLGEYLNGGKASITFNNEADAFTLSLMEGSFGDSAEFVGNISSNGKDAINTFSGEGLWFMGKEYMFKGSFNRDFTRIHKGSVAYSKEIEVRAEAYINELDEYRVALVNYNSLPVKDRTVENKPMMPVNDDLYGEIFVLEAEFPISE